MLTTGKIAREALQAQLLRQEQASEVAPPNLHHAPQVDVHGKRSVMRMALHSSSSLSSKDLQQLRASIVRMPPPRLELPSARAVAKLKLVTS